MSEYPTHLIRRIRHKAFGAEERFVLMVIADHMSKTTDRAWPSVATIALITDYNERTVRRVITWLLSVGALVEFEDGRASRTFGIDFDLLTNLPATLEPRAGKRSLVPGGRTLVPVGRALVPVAMDRTLVPPPLSPSPEERTLVPGGAGPGTGECIREGTKKEPVKEPISAGVPPRFEVPIGAPLVLDFGQTDPSTPTTIPATPTARPEPSKASVESLPVDASNPPPKGKGKAGKRPAGKLTESQAKAHTAAIDCWHETFIEYKNEKPIITGKDIKDIDTLLGVMQWDIDKTCTLIKSAFTHVWFREKNCSIAELVKKPSTYQIPVQSERRSFGQVEPDEDFWTNRDNDLAEDYGS